MCIYMQNLEEDVRIYTRTYRKKEARTDGRTDGWMDGQTDGWMAGGLDRWMDGLTIDSYMNR